MRNAFAAEITSLAKTDERIVLLSGDIGNRLFDNLKKVDQRRFFNCGVAEANMIGVAAGMALCGFRPVVYTIASFATTRCFEQIRVDVCYHRAPVVIVGVGSGLSYAELGPTHQTLEDIAILRSLPEMTVVAPCDATELRLALRAALGQDGPVYIRIGKKGEPAVHAAEPVFSLGKVIVCRPGYDVALLGTGVMMPEVIAAADRLLEHGISAEVVSVHTIKPLDEGYLESTGGRFRLVATVEEHSRIGGLGGAVAEWRAVNHTPGRHLIFGTDDAFMHKIGSQAYARETLGQLTAQHIADKVLHVIRGA